MIGEDKAALLADKIKAVVGSSARVAIPERNTPVLILDVPDWADSDEVIRSLITAGVPARDLTMDGVSKVSTRPSEGGQKYGTVLVNLPLATAAKLAEGKCVTMGWTRCHLKLLEKAQLSCFCCQKTGHMAAECKAEPVKKKCF